MGNLSLTEPGSSIFVTLYQTRFNREELTGCEQFAKDAKASHWVYHDESRNATPIKFCACRNCGGNTRLTVVARIINSIHQALKKNPQTYQRINVISLGSDQLGQELLLGLALKKYWADESKEPLPVSWNLIDPKYSGQSQSLNKICTEAFNKILGDRIGGSQTLWYEASSYLAGLKKEGDDEALHVCLNIDPLLAPTQLTSQESVAKRGNALFLYHEGKGPEEDPLFTHQVGAIGEGTPDSQRLKKDCEAYIMISERSVRILTAPSNDGLIQQVRTVVEPLLDERASVAIVISMLREALAKDRRPEDIKALSDQAVDYRSVVELLKEIAFSRNYSYVTTPVGYRSDTCDDCSCFNLFVLSLRHKTQRKEATIKASQT